jgi:hypothetical protein
VPAIWPRGYKVKAPFHISDLLLDFTLALLQPSRFAYHFFFLFLSDASECISVKFREDLAAAARILLARLAASSR